ncbi:unnamed protein product [Discula destructiva]
MRFSNLLCCGLWAGLVATFSFRPKISKETVVTGQRYDLDLNLSDMLQSGSRLSNTYITALSDLQDLESEPLCHRVAARLLVVNCQLLDGKDEATVFTDSGRQVRDFVDAYAASMAICDLERGRFKIPTACDKFREPTLAQLPIGEQAKLHVTSRQIDLCLSGLGEESSAWSTWISYRHKALRFCEAARADQEKAQNILLYQRLIKVMAKMTHGVEVELQTHMDNFELRIQTANDALRGLEPEFDRIRIKLAAIDKHIAHDLDSSIQRSSDTINHGMQDAAQLQRLLATMIQTIMDGNAHAAIAQETSVALAEQKEADLSAWAALMQGAASSAFTLNSQMELSRLEMEAFSMRQHALSTNLERLVTTTEYISSKYEDHARAIIEANNITNEILETLEGVAGTAAMIEEAERSRWGNLGLGRWLPYILSPVATLLLGSYGLAPSAIRNLGLVVLGEVVGFSVSHLERFTALLGDLAFNNLAGNNTTTAI